MAKKRNSNRKSYYKPTNYNKIVLTKHAYTRLLLRYKNLSFNDMTKKINNLINHGRLLALKGDEEVYSCNGMTFHLIKDFKNGMPVKVLKTVKVNATKKRTHFSNDLSFQTIDTCALGIAN